jgi:hypothetical protein
MIRTEHLVRRFKCSGIFSLVYSNVCVECSICITNMKCFKFPLSSWSLEDLLSLWSEETHVHIYIHIEKEIGKKTRVCDICETKVIHAQNDYMYVCVCVCVCVLSSVGGCAWLIDGFWTGWLDLLIPYTLHLELQAIKRCCYSHTLQVTVTHTSVLSLLQSPLVVSWQRIHNSRTVTSNHTWSLLCRV